MSSTKILNTCLISPLLRRIKMVTVISEIGDEIEPPPPQEVPVSYSRAKESLESYISNSIVQSNDQTPAALDEIEEVALYLPLEKPEQWDYMHVGPSEGESPLGVDYLSTYVEYLVSAPAADDPDDMTGIISDDDDATKAWKKYMHSWSRRTTETDVSRYFAQMGMSSDYGNRMN